MAASSQLGSNMAAGNRGVSRLGMMQAKLQEQLMVEKESRLLEMAARQEAERDYTIQRVTKSSASSLSSSLSSLSLGSSFSGGQGRVRKMFEDRRNTGYDKSYPLQPVRGKPSGRVDGGKPPARGGARNNGRGPSSERTGGGGTKSYGGSYGQQRSKSQIPPNQRTTKSPGANLNRQNNNTVNRLGHHKSNPSLLEANGHDNDNGAPNNNSYGNRSSGGRGPSPVPPTTARRQPPPKKPSPAPIKSSPAPSPRSPAPVKQSIRSKPPASLAPSPIPRRGSTASSAPATPRPVPAGMEQCPVCERNFNSDRIEKHKTICQKSQAKAKKRKVFDPVKMRNKGTEAEKYVARGLHLKEVKSKKKDWRKQHQDFIATVRAAKGVKGYEAPPLDTSDYIECPHCGRKFNQAAGERHIPKCSDIKSNKPAAGRKR